MSLINPRNLIAPLQNKVAIGAIIVVTVLIAVARLSGGGALRGGSDGRARVDPQAQEEAEVIDDSIRDFIKSKEGGRAGLNPRAIGTGQAQAPRGDEFLNQLMQKDTSSKRPTPPKGDAAIGGLNDIKKSLGLE